MGDPLDRHMDKESFQRHGHAVIDWIADYLYERVDGLPVMSKVRPGETRAMLPDAPPSRGESFDEILADIDRVVLPGITNWQHPNWHAYFPANTSGPAILGDLISSGLGVQGMLWSTSPACTEVETHVLDWMAEILGLPELFQSKPGPGCGVIQDTASSATFIALLAARERATNFRSNELGLAGVDERVVAYTSNQAHSSIAKAAMMAGIGEVNLRSIAVDDTFAMDPNALHEAIERDLKDGLVPCFVGATVGTTSSVAFDPIDEIAAVTREHDLWLHVDAAYAGSAAVCPEFRTMHKGIEHADSYTMNPHKWLFTNFACNCFWVRDREPLVRSLTVMPEYLRNKATESGDVIDYRDWQVPLGRRFRALKLWFTLRHYGIEGLQELIRYHVGLAEEFEARVKEHPFLELSVPRALNLICFHHVDGDEATEAMLHSANETGKLFMSHTKLGDRYVARMSIGQSRVQQHHIDSAWEIISRAAEQVSR
jgi:aromatic-L-amino-acid decarboxylase